MNEFKDAVAQQAQIVALKEVVTAMMEERNRMMWQRREVLRGLPNCASVAEAQRFVQSAFEARLPDSPVDQ